MKIIWTDFAKEMLKEIHAYYKDVAGKTVADKLKSGIFESIKQLRIYPCSGQIEEMLSHLNERHRYLVSGNYKIIYKVLDDAVLITDVFDTRQNPIKINQAKRN